jgi:hypothetical protein
MAFTITRGKSKVFQGIGARIVCGTYTSADGSTGGAIPTTLGMCYTMLLQPKGSSVGSSRPVIVTALPTSGSVTIKTGANEVGSWMAIGS